MLRDWIGTLPPSTVPHQTAKLWTAATIAHQTADRRNLNLGSMCHSSAHANFAPLH